MVWSNRWIPDFRPACPEPSRPRQLCARLYRAPTMHAAASIRMSPFSEVRRSTHLKGALSARRDHSVYGATPRLLSLLGLYGVVSVSRAADARSGYSNGSAPDLAMWCDPRCGRHGGCRRGSAPGTLLDRCWRAVSTLRTTAAPTTACIHHHAARVDRGNAVRPVAPPGSIHGEWHATNDAPA